MGLKWIGDWGGSGYGILELCTCSESACVRLRKDEMEVVVLLPSC